MVRYKTKIAAPIQLPDKQTREQRLAEAGYNVFSLPSEDVYIDLLTDSGTGAMSEEQWAALLRGDEAYAGSRSFEEFQTAVADVMGFDRVVPTHQGRGAENLLYGALVTEGTHVPNNTHFDTTRAHVANNGGTPVDCPTDGAMEFDRDDPFKGDLDVDAVRKFADDVGTDKIPLLILTITNNSLAGQPVSMANIRATRELADELDATFVIDACRFAENAYFIQQREPGYEDVPVGEIATEQLRYADAIVMSGKKDGLVNVGGFVAVEDKELFERLKQRAIMYEGFPTYGGLAGRDLAAMAVGLREAVEKHYITDRIEQVHRLGELLRKRGVPIYEPIGGHAIYVDADAVFPHIPAEQFPGQAFVCDLYREGGVRAVELGSLAFPDTERPEIVRLAVPRRMYHDEHLRHVADTAKQVLEHSDELEGFEIVEEPPVEELRHFSAELAPVGGALAGRS